MKRIAVLCLIACALALGCMTAVTAQQTTPTLPAIRANTYLLLSNATASGLPAYPSGGAYLADVRCSNFNSAIVSLQVTLADGSFSTLQPISANGTYGAFSIGAGSGVKALISGGPPTSCYATLEGIGQ